MRLTLSASAATRLRSTSPAYSSTSTPTPIASRFRPRPAPTTPGQDIGEWDLTPPIKEPRYQNEPRYALLVFGPNREQRVWLVLDGATLYVDRHANLNSSHVVMRIPALISNLDLIPGYERVKDTNYKQFKSQLINSFHAQSAYMREKW